MCNYGHNEVIYRKGCVRVNFLLWKYIWFQVVWYALFEKLGWICISKQIFVPYMQEWLHPTFSKEQCLLHTRVYTLMCDKFYHFIIRLLLLLLGNNWLISLILTIKSVFKLKDNLHPIIERDKSNSIWRALDFSYY